jgi:hypothetical protein
MARAEELVGRRRLLTGLAAAVAVALIALIVGVMRHDGSNGDLRTAAGASTTNTTPDAGTAGGPAPAGGESPTTIGASVLGTQFVNTTTTVAPQVGGSTVITGPANKQTPATGAPAQGTTPTTALVCRNSTNPKCGDFRWDPQPKPDQPAQMTITASPAQPKVGEKVTFKVVVDDPDDVHPMHCYANWDYGDTRSVSQHCDFAQGGPPQCQNRHGPWTPPEAAPGHSEEQGGFALEHTYDSPGTYNVKFTYEPELTTCYDPYASSAVGNLSLTVLPAPPV